VASHDLVERVEERGRVERSKEASERTRQPNLGEEGNPASRVACNRRPVAEHDPPAFVPRSFGHTCEQAGGLLVGERQ
jgi:hypothetical protein